MTEIAVDRRYVENLEVALTTLVVMARKHGDSSELLMRAVMVAEHVLTHGYPPKIGSATPASSEALGHTRRSAAQDLPSLDQDRQPLSVEQQVFGVQSHEVVLLLSNIRASAAAGRVYGHGPTPHEPERIIARKDERFDQILAFLTKLGIEGSILRAESAPFDQQDRQPRYSRHEVEAALRHVVTRYHTERILERLGYTAQEIIDAVR